MGKIIKNAGLEIRAQVKALKDKRLKVSFFRNIPNVYLEKWQVLLVCFFVIHQQKVLFCLEAEEYSINKTEFTVNWKKKNLSLPTNVLGNPCDRCVLFFK